MQNEIFDLKEHQGKAEVLFALLSEKNGNEQVVSIGSDAGCCPLISLDLNIIEKCLFQFQSDFKRQGVNLYIGKFKREKNY